MLRTALRVVHRKSRFIILRPQHILAEMSSTSQQSSTSQHVSDVLREEQPVSLSRKLAGFFDSAIYEPADTNAPSQTTASSSHIVMHQPEASTSALVHSPDVTMHAAMLGTTRPSDRRTPRRLNHVVRLMAKMQSLGVPPAAQLQRLAPYFAAALESQNCHADSTKSMNPAHLARWTRTLFASLPLVRDSLMEASGGNYAAAFVEKVLWPASQLLVWTTRTSHRVVYVRTLLEVFEKLHATGQTCPRTLYLALHQAMLTAAEDASTAATQQSWLSRSSELFETEDLLKLLSIVSNRSNGGLPIVIVQRLWREMEERSISTHSIAHLATLRPVTLNSGSRHFSLSQICADHTGMPGRAAMSNSRSLFGPPPHLLSTYESLKFLLSQSLVDSEAHQTWPRELSKFCLEVLKKMRRLRLPPDRQVVASVLHLYAHCGAVSRRSLRDADFLGWIWREWTLLRDHDYDATRDDSILVGFLNSIGREAIHQWCEQAVEMGTLQAAVMPSRRHITSDDASLDDQSVDIHPNLLQAVGRAAMIIGHVDKGLDCLSDSRLPPRHDVRILEGAAERVLRDIDARSVQESLVELVAGNMQNHRAHLADRDAYPISVIATILDMLMRQRRFPLAMDLILAMKHPVDLTIPRIIKYIRALVENRFPQLAHALYQSVPTAYRSVDVSVPILASSHPATSNAVWQDILKRPPPLPAVLLNARLLHHLRSKQPLESARADFSLVCEQLQAQVNDHTREIMAVLLIRNRKLDEADAVCARIADRQRRHRVVNTMLSSAGQRQHLRNHPHGPSHRLTKLVEQLDSHTRYSDFVPDTVTANILLQANMRWGDMDSESIWRSVRGAFNNADKMDWESELEPLGKSVIHAFRDRGCYEDARQVRKLMSEIKEQRRWLACAEEYTAITE